LKLASVAYVVGRALGFAPRLVAIVTACVAIADLGTREWMPTGDSAEMWLRTTNIGGPETPLVGVHSRWSTGWNHPGPAPFFYLWCFHRLSGGEPQAFLVGPFALALIVSSGMALILFRTIGGTRTVLLLLVFLQFGLSLGGALLNPWNPYMLILPLALFVAAAWMTSQGRPVAYPLSVASGSFIVQCHLGLAPVVIGVSAVSFAFALARRLREPSSPAQLAGLASAIGVGSLFWALPVWEQITRTPGNMALIWAFFVQGAADEPSVGWQTGARLAAAQLLPWSQWLNPAIWLLSAREIGAAWLLFPAALLAFTAYLGRRNGEHAFVRLAVILFAAALSTIFAFANIRGAKYVYLTQWASVVGMFVAAAPMLASTGIPRIRALDAERGTVLRDWAVSAAFVGLAIRAVSLELDGERATQAYLRLAPGISQAVTPGQKVTVRSRGGWLEPYSAALILKRAGAVPLIFDPTRSSTENHGVRRDLPELVIASGVNIDDVSQRPGARVVAEYDPLPTEERAKANRLLEELLSQLRAARKLSLMPLLDATDRKAQRRLPSNISAGLLARYQDLACGAGGKQCRLAAILLPPR
jgi:hypothetical protein